MHVCALHVRVTLDYNMYIFRKTNHLMALYGMAVFPTKTNIYNSMECSVVMRHVFANNSLDPYIPTLPCSTEMRKNFLGGKSNYEQFNLVACKMRIT